jgi:diguanylate cyclase (GGDEF)-like protein
VIIKPVILTRTIINTLEPQAVMTAGGFMALVFGGLLLAQCLRSKTDRVALALLLISVFCAAGGLFTSAIYLNRAMDLHQMIAPVLGTTAYLCGSTCLIYLYRPSVPKRLLFVCALVCYSGFVFWPLGIATRNWNALCQFNLACIALAVVARAKDPLAPKFRWAWLGLCLFSLTGLTPRVVEIMSIPFDGGTDFASREVSKHIDTAAYRIRALTWTITVAVSYALTTGLIHARKNKQLQQSIDIDLLTGAHSRRYLVERTNQHFKERRNSDLLTSEQSTALLMIDIDHFKKVNDTWGHDVGDSVLKHCVQSIRQVIRQDDAVVSRYGGEEFCVFLPRCSPEQATELAERIRQQVAEKLYWHGNETIRLTVSIGCVHGNESNTLTSLKALISLADQRLYKAKQSGRNRVILQSDVLVI